MPASAHQQDKTKRQQNAVEPAGWVLAQRRTRHSGEQLRCSTLACRYSACQAAMGSSTAVFSSRLCSTQQNDTVSTRRKALRSRAPDPRSFDDMSFSGLMTHPCRQGGLLPHPNAAAVQSKGLAAGISMMRSVLFGSRRSATHVRPTQLSRRHEACAGAGQRNGRASGALVPHAGHWSRKNLLRGRHDACGGRRGRMVKACLETLVKDTFQGPGGCSICGRERRTHHLLPSSTT